MYLKRQNDAKDDIMDYNSLLTRARSKVRAVAVEERLKIPEPETSILGKTTTIRNFGDIAGVIRRDPKHLAKFLFRELAIPGTIEENRLVLQRAFDRELISKALKSYYSEFLYCKECGKADTNITKKEDLLFLKCEACGAERSIKKI